MFSVSPEIYNVLSLASRWLFAFFALMLLVFALSWHHLDRKRLRERFKNLPGAGTVGELIVLSGSDELLPDTWFPVPREGVLGSLRSCDLVVPCPGVRSQHLDFSWQDGVGLLIRPRVGCEALADGIPVSRRGINADTPLLHGSVLQVGSAVLRLQLYSALSHTNRTFTPQVPPPMQVYNAGTPAYPPPVQMPAPAASSFTAPPVSAQPVPDQPACPQPFPEQYLPVPDQPETLPQTEPAQRRRPADRWKEDWSE